MQDCALSWRVNINTHKVESFLVPIKYMPIKVSITKYMKTLIPVAEQNACLFVVFWGHSWSLLCCVQCPTIWWWTCPHETLPLFKKCFTIKKAARSNPLLGDHCKPSITCHKRIAGKTIYYSCARNRETCHNTPFLYVSFGYIYVLFVGFVWSCPYSL